MTKLTNEELLKHLYEYQQQEDQLARVKFLVEIMKCGWTLEEYCIVQKNNEVGSDKAYTAEDYRRELETNKEFADAVAVAEELFKSTQ